MNAKRLRTARLGIAALACLAMSACVGIPTAGDVNQGDTEVAQPGAFVPILEGPEVGANPREIVQGFMAASAGGTVSGFEVAREFLTQDAAASWDPLARVVVYDSRQVVPSFDEVSGTFIYSLPVAADVDVTGVLTEAAADVRREVKFSVGLDATGEYRITGLDDGVVMSAADFGRFFRPVSLGFAAKDADVVVPELRWFANNPQVATAVAGELIDGPSPWLADAVRTGFPPGSTLDVDAVVVDEGTATVALAPGAAGTAGERSLASEQLRVTLLQLSAVQDVKATVGVLPLGGETQMSLETAALAPESAAVIAAGRLGLFDGSNLTVTPAELGVLPADAHGLALGFDGTSVAFVSGGDVWVSTALADAGPLEAYVGPQEADADAGEVPTLGSLGIDGANLVEPSYDSRGWLWTGETQSTGVLLGLAPDGALAEVQAPWLAGRTVQAIAVSRDGARVAVLSRIGEEQTLEIAALVRDETGAPTSIGEPLAIGASLRPSVDIAWADDTSVVTLAQDAGEIAITQVGGWTQDLTSVTDAVSITTRNGERSLLTVTADGMLWARSGTGWKSQVELGGVADIAYAG